MRKSAIYGIIAAIVVAAGTGIAFATMNMNNNNTTEPAAAQQPPSNQVRVINHTMGETEITGTPKRVVTLYSVFTGDVRALGVQPVGSVDRDFTNGWLTPIGLPLSDNVTDLGTPAEPNLEVIAQLEPDLIIGQGGVWGTHDEMYEELNAIAPTLIFDDAPVNSTSNELEVGKSNFMAIADALNRQDQGIAYLQKVESVYNVAAQKIQQAGLNGTKFVLAQANLQNDVPGAYIFTQNSFTTKVLNNIGLINEIPDPTDTNDKWYQTGMEGLTTIDKPDTHLIVTYNAGQYESNPLATSPLWNNLGFVKDSRVHDIGNTRVFGQVIFIEDIVNRVVNALTSDSGTRTISHAMGETEITGTPQRVVVLDNISYEILWLLGVEPVGVSDIEERKGWYPQISLSSNVTDVGFSYEPNLEAIAQLEPDLILGWEHLNSNIYDELNAIAPTLLFNQFPEQGGPNALNATKSAVIGIADALNQHDKGVEIINKTEAKFDDVVSKLASAGLKDKKVVMIDASVQDGNPRLRLYAPNSLPVLTLGELGLVNISPAPEEFDRFGSPTISLEVLSTLDDDPNTLLLYAQLPDNDPAPVIFKDNPVWNNLSFVREGRTYNLGEINMFAGPIQIEKFADAVAEALNSNSSQVRVINHAMGETE
jgi:ABC-type Fe3+-hydroxamate transport system substrate-binding protein